MIWEYKTIKLSELKPATYNPREISKDEFEGLKNSLKTFGFADPAVVNSNNNVIVGGHQRIKAWEALGNKDVPCMLAPLTEEQEKKLNVLLNSQAISGKYDDLMLSELLEGMKLDDDYEALRLDQLEPLDLSDTEVEEDEVPEISQEPPKSELGKVYQLGRHRVMCGDSTDKENVELLMDGVEADLLLTDPPYGIDYGSQLIKGDEYTEKTNKHGWRNFGKPEWDIKRPEEEVIVYMIGLAPNSIIWGGNYFADYLPPSQGWLVWDKGQRDFSLADGEMAWSSFDNAMRIKTFSRASANKEEKHHATQKPQEIIKWCLDYADRFSKKAPEIIIDLYLGSGSTLIACEQTDRTCYGMELDERYVDVIRKRYAKFVYPDRWEEEWEELTKEVA